MSEMMINTLVDRFLAWPLPASVCSDLCATQQGNPHRSGTTLLTAVEAKQMIEHLLAALPPAMTWTSKQPMNEGWYWRRNNEWPNGYMIQIEQNDLDGMARKRWYPGGQWAGPIAPPEEPPQ